MIPETASDAEIHLIRALEIVGPSVALDLMARVIVAKWGTERAQTWAQGLDRAVWMKARG